MPSKNTSCPLLWTPTGGSAAPVEKRCLCLDLDTILFRSWIRLNFLQASVLTQTQPSLGLSRPWLIYFQASVFSGLCLNSDSTVFWSLSWLRFHHLQVSVLTWTQHSSGLCFDSGLCLKSSSVLFRSFIPSGNPSHEHLTLNVEHTTHTIIHYVFIIYTYYSFQTCTYQTCTHIIVYIRGHQTWSWRAGVLQSLAPTCLNTPAWKFQVYLVGPWLAASGVFD